MGRIIRNRDRIRFIEEMDRKWYRKYRSQFRQGYGRDRSDVIIEHPYSVYRPA